MKDPIMQESLGTLEDAVRETRKMDEGIRQLAKYERNAPLLSEGRRHFMKTCAIIAAGITAGKILGGCATTGGGFAGYQGSFEYEGETYYGWQAFLLQQDLIRGPELYRKSRPRKIGQAFK